MARANPAFQKRYKQLNTAQREAVDAIEGPVMVVAGPGTGKTQILTLRIANILRKTDTPPDAILALTFTESAAAHMKRRLASIVGADAYRVHIHTFHGFCNDVIQRFPEEFPRIIGGEPITDVEKLSLLRDIITESKLEHLKPFGNNFHYLDPLRRSIGELKREAHTSTALAEHVARERAQLEELPDLTHTTGIHRGKVRGKYQTLRKKIDRTDELTVLYEAYEAALHRRRQYDFEDMIVEVVTALETNEDLRLRLQEEFLYVLADEHQDANRAQNRLIELLVSFHEQPNLFVVGDDRQAIFRFQGASIDTFQTFRERYPDAHLVTLTGAYRSGQIILDVSHALMQRATSSRTHTPQQLTSLAGMTNDVVTWRHFSGPAYEQAWVAEDVARHIAEGVEPAEIVVLYRTNGEAAALAEALERRGVQVSIESDQNVLTDPTIRKLLTLIRSVAYFGADEQLAAALHLDFLQIPPLTFYKIARYARRNHLLLADVCEQRTHLTKAGVADPERVQHVYRKMAGWAHEHGAVPQLVERIIHESGFLSSVVQGTRAVEVFERLHALLRDVELLAVGNPDYTLHDLVAHIALLEEYRVPVQKDVRRAPTAAAVRLMTAHRAKGLEFDYVYIVNLVDGVWGGRQEWEHFLLPAGAASGTDEDERRLLYVALTRARLGVSLSASQESATGSERLPSRFMSELNPKLVTTHSVEVFEESAQVGIAAPRSAGESVQAEDKTFLQELFLEQGLSVTALNNYLTCPWQYFYSSLVRIPKVPDKHMLFGTAMHRTLKRYFDGYARSGRHQKRQLTTLLKEEVKRLPLDTKQLNVVRERGERFLSGWYDQWHRAWSRDIRNEYRVLTELPVTELPVPLRLRGDLDKIIFDEGGVTVVDYKTGRPATRNAILGKTKNDKLDYWRQLVFYKVLLEREGKYLMHSGELDFLQPDARDAYRKERFEVQNRDVEEMEKLISTTARAIYALDFWNTRCGEKNCEYCALRDLVDGVG